MPRVMRHRGDGIGKEVIPAAVRGAAGGVPGLEIIRAEAGWDCFQRRGVSVPAETLAAVRDCGAALFGAVSSPSRKVDGYRSAILTLRQELDLYANLRPVRSLPVVSPAAGMDLLIVRENTEGLYAGRERLEGDTAIAERVITRAASYRIGRKAVELAHRRRAQAPDHRAQGQCPAGDRRPVPRHGARGGRATWMPPGTAWRWTNCWWIRRPINWPASPKRFDVIVTTNLFGDILSDEAAYWCGGMGLAPSLNWGDGRGAGRAGARFGAGYRRQGHRQPDRRHPERGAAGALHLGAAGSRRSASKPRCTPPWQAGLPVSGLRPTGHAADAGHLPNRS